MNIQEQSNISYVYIDTVTRSNVFYTLTNVYPNQEYVTNSVLNINGLNFYLDSWIDYSGGIHPGRTGSITNKGFTLSYSGSLTTTAIKWNYSSSLGGFNPCSGDILNLSYYA